MTLFPPRRDASASASSPTEGAEPGPDAAPSAPGLETPRLSYAYPATEKEAFLLSRVLLRFDEAFEDARLHLSAAAFTPDGSLWVASDELRSVERLTEVKPYVYGAQASFDLTETIPGLRDDEEIDIEGMDYSDGYLWIVGSHSTKRKNPKGKDQAKDLKRLATIETEANRFLLARIPVHENALAASSPDPDGEGSLSAALLGRTGEGSVLMDLLKDDDHLKPYFASPLPSKENGIDVEGLAVRGGRVFIGFRGPVLRGYALIVQLELAEDEPGVLKPKKIGSDGERYLKHFVDLNGLGVRELALCGKDLLILAGPTMDLEAPLSLFRLKNPFKLDRHSISYRGDLELLFDLPFRPGSDHAEGMALTQAHDGTNAVLLLYDSPWTARLSGKRSVYADLFRLDV